MKDMLGRNGAVTPAEALEKVLSSIPQRPAFIEETALDEAFGRVLAEDVHSPEDLPSFSRSTMDGFAVDSKDTFGASETSPAYLTFSLEIKMAEEPLYRLKKGECAKVPTGGMLPQGADAVVMFEHCGFEHGNKTLREGQSIIEVFRPVAPGENVIRRAEDAAKGDLILKAGSVLRPQDVAAAAGVGVPSLKVFRRPVVSIIVTGDEIVPPDAPMRPGCVRDINSYNLAGLAGSMGAVALREGIFGDDYGTLEKILADAASRADMVLITGGSSVGTRDYTARLISEHGEILFHGVALKPGKPLIGGILMDGKNKKNKKPVFGLPGHPAAVGVCFELFVKPALKRLAGAGDTSRESFSGVLRARLSRDVSSQPGRMQFIRVALDYKDGELWAEPVLGPSGLITTFTRSDGAAVCPAERPGLHKGELVEVRLF